MKKYWKIFLGIVLSVFTFTACNDLGSSFTKDNIFGKLVDSAVVGARYECGTKTGYTNVDGNFTCTVLPVSFYIGSIKLGEASVLNDDGKVFPQDIMNVSRNDVNHTEVVKLALLLQSLDADGNASNGIEITKNTRDTYNEEIIVADLNLTQLKNKLREKKADIQFIDVDEVVRHLRVSLGLSFEHNTSENGDTNSSSNENNITTTDNNQTQNSDSNTSSENNTTTTDNNQTENTDSNSSSEDNTTTPDTTAPSVPTLTVTPIATNVNSLSVLLNGEASTEVYVNNVSVGTISADGTLNLNLDTSGDDGIKSFEVTLRDSSNNISAILTITVTKDTLAPAENSTIDNLTTDDTTPALSGSLPSGTNDANTTNYAIKIKIADESYDAVNNKNGKWSIADDIISVLDLGFHDVNITVTDEANNSSSTFLAGKIEIDNTGFLIDSALEGIKYISGSYSGYTDKDGLFKYDKGSGVTFYVGDESTGISLGTAIEKIDPHNLNRRIISLFDLAGTQDENNSKVINMGKFLQSLDSDNDVSNGITIDERTKESIVLLGLKNRIDFNINIDDFHVHNDIYELFNDLAGHFGEHRGLADTEDVKAHMVAVRDNKLATKSYDVAKVSGEKELIKVLEGVFQSIGGVVEGLEYRSGNQFGRTDASGVFKYEEGKTVKFYIYQLELGITEGKAVVTPADLVPFTSFNHPKPRNIIRLLKAFDASAGTNILIDSAVREALEKYRSQIDINLPDGKANTELNIPQGIDEFGAQFEDFELGKDILDEIDSIRGEA